MLSSTIQGVVAAWVMTAVALLNAFVPGITEVQQTALVGFATATVTLGLIILNKFAPDTIDKDPASDFERARVRLAKHVGIMMPSIAEHTAPAAVASADGWPPPQNNS